MRSSTMLVLMLILASAGYSQRPRAVESEPATKTAPSPAPTTVSAKYEGGVFGYNKTMEGTLTFDDLNNRLLFKDKKTPKEIHIPYDALTSAFADTQKRRPAAATVASNVPLYGIPAGFIKTKVRYLTLQYNDPDSKQYGVTSFRLENGAVLASVLARLVQTTGMTKRGDIYIKKKDVSQLTP